MHTLIVGSRVPKTAEGLSVWNFEEETGTLSFVSSTRGIDYPTFLTYNNSNERLYCVSETKDGSVANFSFEEEKLTFLHSQKSLGDDPCHLALSPKNNLLAVSNYSSGTLTLLSLDSEGNLLQPIYSKQFTGRGTDPIRQKGSHIHSSLWTEKEDHLFVADLGLDRILHYTTESLNTPSFKKTPLKTGPRHMILSQDGTFLFVAGELSNEIVVYRIDKYDSCFTLVQTISTLPETFTGNNTVADIHLQGSFLYCSNRGHDSIATYHLDTTSGMLTLVGITSTLGKEPRNFCISPEGKFLLVANASSDELHVFALDRTTGLPTVKLQTITIEQPVCLVFTERRNKK